MSNKRYHGPIQIYKLGELIGWYFGEVPADIKAGGCFVMEFKVINQDIHLAYVLSMSENGFVTALSIGVNVSMDNVKHYYPAHIRGIVQMHKVLGIVPENKD